MNHVEHPPAGEQGRPRGLWARGAPAAAERASIAEFVLLSALFLFWEICLIRWLSTEIRVFAYYKNLPLLGAYLGFGIGLLTDARQRRWLESCLVRLLVMVLLIVSYPSSPLRLDQAPAFFQEFTWHVPEEGLGVALRFYALILLVFVANAAVFVPWGRRIGFYFDRLRPIPAYSINVGANLAGIAAFSLISAFETPPWVWVALGLVPLLALRLRGGGFLVPAAVSAATLALVVLAPAWTDEHPTRWSPYYKITLVPPADGGDPFHTLEVNHDYHQRILDLRPETIERSPHRNVLERWAASYELPYRVGRPERVLVVGAGTGNDVAAALRHGAKHVTAVEIDPTILAIGREIHPEAPYAAPGVEVEITDARYYLSDPPAGARFDTIVFGLLDSHTQVSGMNSLRLDNFVYTRESLTQARNLLDPEHGVLSLSFSAGSGTSSWTVRRIYRMLFDVFGEVPSVAFTGYDSGVFFLAGPGLAGAEFLATPTFNTMSENAMRILGGPQALREPPATDDWPFLYLERPGLPLEYWFLIALVATTSAVWVLLARRARAGGAGARGFSLHFFLLGAAFLLIEVKNLAAFSLLFGSTWQVNNFAIGGILSMILLANLVAARARRLDPYWLYGGLLLTLLLGFVVGPEQFSGLDRSLQVVLLPLVLSLPIFCAGLVFIRSFAVTSDPAGALGANIIGGICGGLLENASMALGISALQWLALALYALSFVAMLRERRG